MSVASKTSDTENPAGEDQGLCSESSIDNVVASRAKHEEPKNRV
jgi:hypothetical protein